jgi:hypothetical protein
MAALAADGELVVVEQRSSLGHRQGGRGSSRRRCGARAVTVSSKGDRGQHYVVAQ